MANGTPDVTITVTLKDGSTNPPKIKLKDTENHDPGNDDLTTEVDPGWLVEWVPGTGIGSIKNIVKKDNDPDDYNLISSSSQNGNNYQATIVTPSPGKNKKEKYKIGFTLAADTTQHVYWDDPKIQMKK